MQNDVISYSLHAKIQFEIGYIGKNLRTKVVRFEACWVSQKMPPLDFRGYLFK